MPEWLMVALPYAVPLVVAALTAIAGTTFAGKSHLRKGLNSDAMIVSELSGDAVARAALLHDIERRTARLVVLSRLPAFRGGDLVRLAAIFAIASVVALTARDVDRHGAMGMIDTLIPVVGLCAINALLWFAFIGGWQNRAGLRRALHEVLDVRWDENRVIAIATDTAIALFGALIVIGPPTSLALAAIDHSGHAEGGAFLLVLIVASAFVATFALHPTGKPSKATVTEELAASKLIILERDAAPPSVDPLADSKVRRLLRWLAFAGRGGVPRYPPPPVGRVADGSASVPLKETVE